MVKHVADSALSTNFTFCFGKTQAYITKSTVRVVGQAVDNHYAAAGAITFISGWCKVFTAAAFSFVDGFFNDVGRHLIFLGSIN